MKITSAKDAGAAIRERRKKLGYTQADVADVCGFSVSFISDVENGKPTAELEKTILLLNTLGIDLIAEER